MEFQGKQFTPSHAEDGTASWEYQVGAYKVSGSVQAQGSRAVVKLVMHKEMNPGGVAFSTEAVIQEMSGDLNVQIRNYKTQHFRFFIHGMEGIVVLIINAADCIYTP